MARLTDAEKLKNHYAWWKGGTRVMTMDEAKSGFDVIVDLQVTVDAIPISWIRSQIDFGKWQELVQRWREENAGIHTGDN